MTTTTALLSRHADGLERMTLASADGSVSRSGALAFVDSGIDVPAFNTVVVGQAWSSSDLAALADVAAATRRPWSVAVQVGTGTGMDVARTAAVERVATAHGLTAAEDEPFLVSDRDRFAAVTSGLPDTGAGGGLVRQVAGVDAHRYTEALGEGFELPAEVFGDVFGGGVLDDPDIAGYLVTEGERDVATGLGIETGEALGVYDIAVVPEARRRGTGRAVTVRVVLDGFARGATHAFLVSTPAGRPLYDALGFRQVDTLVRWSAPEE